MFVMQVYDAKGLVNEFKYNSFKDALSSALFYFNEVKRDVRVMLHWIIRYDGSILAVCAGDREMHTMLLQNNL